MTDLHEEIMTQSKNLNILFNSNFYDMLNEIFTRNLYEKDDIEIPLFSFIQKINTIYVYDKDNFYYAHETTTGHCLWS